LNRETQYDTLASSYVIDPAEDEIFDTAIIGGGLAGLALSIQLAEAGYKVILFEKECYPFHRVCGEYISMESWNFLESLGYPLGKLDLPLIKKLVVSSPDGNYISHPLAQGGFGISRYKIDAELAEIAKDRGVVLMEGTKVTDVNFAHSMFSIRCSNRKYRAKIACGTFGKRSNLDLKWKRPFARQKHGGLNNYIGVKYHIRTDFPSDTIALHNFSNGYCGISQVEDGIYNLCYLTTARNLSISQHSIGVMEANILHRNPFLRKIFHESEVLFKSPLTISQVSFEKKSQVENHVLLVGDAGGLITPLCGNGMSMALHGSRIAANLVIRYLSKKISRQQLEENYIMQWNQAFQKRLQAGRLMQRLFGREWLTNIFIHGIKPFPSFISYLIRQTHGEPF
jgi:flavin-dependent dehydrogenase